ncbi:MAG: translocation/assembly module TamB domain-containing protein [Spirochaetales bacterium]|nr:translocation/assembly module TamB domain-containing protein [Spirochaetales bacterium]
MKLRAPAPLAIAATIVITVAAVWAFASRPLLARLESMAAAALEREVGAIIGGQGFSASYGSASPRLIGSVRLAAVRIAAGENLELSAASAEMTYDTGALLSGRLVVRKIRVEGLVVDAAYDDVVALVERLTAAAGSGGTQATASPGPTLEIRRASVNLRFDDGLELGARVRAADLVFRDDGRLGASIAGSLRVIDPSRRALASLAELPFSCSAELGVAPLEGSVSAILAGSSDIGTLSQIRLDGAFGEGEASVTLKPAGGVEEMVASWNADTGRLSFYGSFSRWHPRALFSPSGSLEYLLPWFDAEYSGSVSGSTDMSVAGTEGRVDLSGSLPLDLPGGNARFRVSAAGGWRAIRVATASIRNATLDASFSGSLRPSTLGAEGRLGLGYVIADGLRASAEFEVSGAGSSWFAYAPELRAADTALRDATITLDLAEDSATFYMDAGLPSAAGAIPVSFIAGAEPAAYLEPSSGTGESRLVVEGTVVLGTEPYLEAVVRFGDTKLSAFDGILRAMLGSGAAAALSPLGVGGEISLYSDFKGLSFNASNLLLVYDGVISGFGVTSFSGGLGRLEVRSFDATIGGYSISGSASMDYGDKSSAGFEADFRVEDVPYALSGAMVDESIVLFGDYGLRFVARSGADSYLASLSVVDMPVPLFNTVSFLSAAATIRFVEMDEWSFVLVSFSLAQPPGSSRPIPSIAATGAFNQNGGRFGELRYADTASKLQGAMDVTWALGDGFRVSASGRVDGPDGEYYVLTGEYRREGYISGTLMTRKAPLARLGIPVLRGVLDVDASVSGVLEAPLVDFQFTMNGGQRADDLPFAAGSGSYEGGVVTLVDSRARLGAHTLDGLSLEYGIDDAALELSATLSLAVGKTSLSGELSATGVSELAGEATVAAPTEIQERASPFDAYRLTGVLSTARWGSDELGAIPLSLTRSQGYTVVAAGNANQVRGSLGPAGELVAAFAPSMPLSFSASGRIADASISLDVSDAVVDLPFLFGILELPIVRVDSGRARGELKIRGTTIDPSVEGVVEFENFYLSVPDFVPAPIGPLTEPLFFTGGTMETNQTGVPCEGATLMLSLEAILHGGLPDDISISVRREGEGLVPIATRLLGLDIIGTASPDLRIAANAERTRIDGAITLSSGDIVLTTDVVRQKSGESDSYDLSGALDLAFGKGVRVYFPDKRLPIVYGQADPSSKLSVSFDVARGDYSLDGTTTLRGGSVIYIQRNFYLKSATIEFAEDADQFDPMINLEAETRSDAGDGTVVVTLRAVDRRLSDLSFVLESVPSMSEADIQQMLGKNLVGGTEEGRMDLGRAVVENLDLIPQLNVTSVFERNLQSLLGLDLFVVRSLVFQRWLYDVSGLSDSTEPTTLADYLDDTAIVAGKYLGDKLFFQLMLALGADPLASTTALRLDSDISLEWKAPHFTLNWSVQPENLDSLFIEDQSFSFLWRIPLK